MTKPFVVAIPHQLGAVEAKRRLETGIDQAKEQYAGKMAVVDNRWTGDHLDFTVTAMTQTVSGTIDVSDEQVVLAVQLPWYLSLLAEKVQPLLRQKGQLLLEKK